MPELPEVERARKLIEESLKGYKIAAVDTKEDKIVYTAGTDHLEFAKEIEGRTITGCKRKGKTFWMELSGKGRWPVMHFGMTGMVQGQEPFWYRRRPKERPKDWPPKFYKFAIDLEPQAGSVGDEPRSLAFCDARRLGRLRLVEPPVEDKPPVSQLGFDPILSMPDFETFKGLLKRKKGTIKGVIMDQSFSAGVGNWVADEILYQARLHPACPVPALTEDDLQRLHHWVRKVPEVAVGVNADSMKFPEDWLFRWRWAKGTKQKNRLKKAGLDKAEDDVKSEESEVDGVGGDAEGEVDMIGQREDITPKNVEYFKLPDGKPATISFIEVGGRTTAVVDELQKMPEGVAIKEKVPRGTPKKDKGGVRNRRPKKKASESEESELSELEEVEDKVEIKRERASAKRGRKSVQTSEVKQDAEATPRKRPRKSKATPPAEVKSEPDPPSSRKAGRGGRKSSGASRKRRAGSSELSDAP